MANQEQQKKELEIESIEATEVEEEDLEEVSGGNTDNNCGCYIQPTAGFGPTGDS